jgi:2-polyprenyl-6-methoxyphenol hydroxylase-like FAD-dependent oxidoreductase
VVTGRRCTGVTQDDGGVELHLQDATGGAAVDSVRADVLIACDGVNSAIRRQYYPKEGVAFTGINTWRGVTRHKPILDGRTYIRIGSLRHCKLVVYPIVDNVDGEGNQLINWVAEVQTGAHIVNDWNKPGKLEDFLPNYAGWRFDWLDVPALISNAENIFEYPMVDKDPVPHWTFGRVTFAGDAAHPMYPRGSNGSAQALIDVRTLADLLATGGDPASALKAYEDKRLQPTANVVLTNRSSPPDFINIRVEELTGDQPFDNLDALITQAELRELSEQYKRIAGFGVQDVK